MLIRCPTCSSGYDLAPALVTEGRALRCARCRAVWTHAAPVDLPAGPEILAEALFFRPVLPQGAGRRGSPARGGAAALALLAALGAGSVAAVACKAAVVAAWPPAAAAFAAVGLPVNLTGLALIGFRSAVEDGEGPRLLTLEGRVTNLRAEATDVPPLRIAVRDKEGRELYNWTAPAPKARLLPGESVAFRSRLTASPAEGRDVAVSFAEGASGRRRLAGLVEADR